MKPPIKKMIYAQVKKEGNSKCVILKKSDFPDLKKGAWVKVIVEEIK